MDVVEETGVISFFLLFSLPKRKVVLQQREDLEGLFVHFFVSLNGITGVIVRLLCQFTRLCVT